jgi:hypothetical protein
VGQGIGRIPRLEVLLFSPVSMFLHGTNDAKLQVEKKNSPLSIHRNYELALLVQQTGVAPVYH